MPHMSIRISASSSMTRMSCAMSRRLLHHWTTRLHGRPGRHPRLAAIEHQQDARAAAVAVLEQQLAAMVFHDLLDDGKPKAGALGARRHIGLDQPLASFVRQASAVV